MYVMVHRDDPDAHESSELDERAGRRERPHYGSSIGVDYAPPDPGYTKVVIAWASLITVILISTFAYLWNVKDAGDARRDSEIMMLWSARAQDRETIGRMESHIEYLQKQVDRMQK